MRWVWCLTVVVSLWAGQGSPAALPQGKGETPVFKSGVSLVTVSAVVRDQRGRIVSNLTRNDFEVLDEGRPRPITDFRVDQAPVTIALLLDASGSMNVASKLDAARAAASQLTAWLQPERDQVALFTFDSDLREVRGFGGKEADLGRQFEGIEAYGLTSLHDAIAEAARRVARHGGSHRGVVVLTDGVDTASHLTASEVSGVASGIDVPVYVLTVVSPLDDPGSPARVVPKEAREGGLSDLARWTGGTLFVTSTAGQVSVASRRIVEELRYQYLLAFEPGGNPGWHPLEVRARDGKLVVRARSGYFAGNSVGAVHP